MTPDGLLDGDDIRRLVSEVADELGPLSSQRTLVIVGGSLLAWHGLRDATQDVDTIRQLDDELKSAVAVVAARHGLSVSWLNDHAAAFAPFTFELERCELLVEHPALLVLGLPLRDVFLMKLRRADPADLNDIRALWPHVSDAFTTARHIAAAFDAAFPDEPVDDYLAEFVVAQLLRGGFDLPLE
jgi:hypothetical protein